jgi:hypothetical protein
VNAGAALLETDLRTAIYEAIIGSQPAWNNIVAASRARPGDRALAVKYVPSKYASTYRAPNKGLFIGRSNFTWGSGIYVTSIAEPLSTAIYGRVGIVSSFDPAGWRAFDARVPANEQLYLRWLHAQPVYPEAVLTVHNGHWLHELRNHFRAQFNIDVVLFHPDERDSRGWYTDATHTWLAVSDWKSPGMLSEKDYSDRFHDARLTIVSEEEFIADKPALTRSPLFALSGASPVPPANVHLAYSTGIILKVSS